MVNTVGNMQHPNRNRLKDSHAMARDNMARKKYAAKYGLDGCKRAWIQIWLPPR